jgi:hypothetical protein
MTFSLYQACAPVLIQTLKGLAAVLDKAEAFAAERKLDPAVVLQTRLYPDMFAFTRQVQIVSDSAKGAMARLAGVEVPSWPDNEASFEELKARVAKTLDYVQGFKPEQLDGAETREVVMQTPGEPLKFTGQVYLTSFVLPNVLFHATTAYALMRGLGVPVGKYDFLAVGR